MGDNLAQILFETLQAQGADIPPFRRITWDELSAVEQLHWDAVASKAREEMDLRFRRDMRDAVAFHGAEAAIANLLEKS